MTISSLCNGLKNASWQSIAGYSGAAACVGTLTMATGSYSPGKGVGKSKPLQAALFASLFFAALSCSASLYGAGKYTWQWINPPKS